MTPLREILKIVKEFGQYSPSLDNMWNQITMEDHHFILNGYSLCKIPDKQVIKNIETLLNQRKLSHSKECIETNDNSLTERCLCEGLD